MYIFENYEFRILGLFWHKRIFVKISSRKYGAMMIDVQVFQDSYILYLEAMKMSVVSLCQ